MASAADLGSYFDLDQSSVLHCLAQSFVLHYLDHSSGFHLLRSSEVVGFFARSSGSGHVVATFESSPGGAANSVRLFCLDHINGPSACS